MRINTQELGSMAFDARIALDGDETAALVADLNKVLEHLDIIKTYDLDGVPPTFTPLAGIRNVMRDDVPAPSLPQPTALANAGDTEDGQFKVPPILSEDGGDR